MPVSIHLGVAVLHVWTLDSGEERYFRAATETLQVQLTQTIHQVLWHRASGMVLKGSPATTIRQHKNSSSFTSTTQWKNGCATHRAEEEVTTVSHQNLECSLYAQREDNLARKTREEILDLAESATRLQWLWDPFDIVEAPPCGPPHGGYCPR